MEYAGYVIMPRVREVVFSECLFVLARIPQDGAQTRCAGAASAHEYHVAVDISGGDPVFFYKTQHQLKIRRTADRGVKATVTDKAALFTIECGVCRAPAALEGSRIVFRSAPCAYGVPYSVDVVQITVYGICSMPGKCPGDGFQYIFVLVIVIRIQKTDDISCGHAYPLVHGIINSLVRLG